jgi:hypothetical protein
VLEEALVVGFGVLFLLAIVMLVLVIGARGSASGGARPVRRYTTRTDSDSVMLVESGSSEALMGEGSDHPDQDGGHHHHGGGHHGCGHHSGGPHGGAHHDGGHHDGGGHYGGDGGGGHHGG